MSISLRSCGAGLAAVLTVGLSSFPAMAQDNPSTFVTPTSAITLPNGVQVRLPFSSTQRVKRLLISKSLQEMQAAVESCNEKKYKAMRTVLNDSFKLITSGHEEDNIVDDARSKIRSAIPKFPEPCPSETATRPWIADSPNVHLGVEFRRTAPFRGRSTPQVGMVIEPKISFGLNGSSGTSSYDSTGGQDPFNGDWSHWTSQVCGGATFYPGFVIGAARVGLDVNVCSGSNTFGSNDTRLFTIMRHGPGDVALRSSTNVIIDTLFKAEVPLGDPQAQYDPKTQRWFLSAGIGPTFREQNLALTSDQSFFGGGIPSISSTTWQTGLVVSAGLSTFVCPNCIAGNPLKVGIEGRARFFSSQSIGLRSPAFGFTETGSTGSTTDYSALITISTPIRLGQPDVDDNPRYHVRLWQ
jgi:hypothetical protein